MELIDELTDKPQNVGEQSCCCRNNTPIIPDSPEFAPQTKDNYTTET